MLPTSKVIWLDCDPGHDDAVALILACFAPNCELIGVSTTAGNQTLDKTTLNALRVLRLIGHGQIPVVAGADRPLLAKGASVLEPCVACGEPHPSCG